MSRVRIPKRAVILMAPGGKLLFCSLCGEEIRDPQAAAIHASECPMLDTSDDPGDAN